MDTAEVLVTAGGLLAIVWVLWYFFFPDEGRRVRAGAGAGGVQQIRILVKGGYEPDVVVVRQGQPVRLEFYRDETASCSETVVFPDLGIVRNLPPFRTTPVEFTPDRPGEFPFHCGMTMLRGRVIVEPREGEPA